MLQMPSGAAEYHVAAREQRRAEPAFLFHFFFSPLHTVPGQSRHPERIIIPDPRSSSRGIGRIM